MLINIAALIAAGRGGGKIQGFGAFGLDLFGPVEHVLSKITGSVEKIWMNYFSLVRLSSENNELLEEIKQFHSKETLYKEVVLETKGLEGF